MISIEALETMFNDIRRDAPWNIDGAMLWGYFFKDDSEAKLRALVPALEAHGYRFVDVFINEGNADQTASSFFLHVEKTEIHSVQSLHARNQQLSAFAEQHHIGSYDGMDVGPAVTTVPGATVVSDAADATIVIQIN